MLLALAALASACLGPTFPTSAASAENRCDRGDANFYSLAELSQMAQAMSPFCLEVCLSLNNCLCPNPLELSFSSRTWILHMRSTEDSIAKVARRRSKEDPRSHSRGERGALRQRIGRHEPPRRRGSGSCVDERRCGPRSVSTYRSDSR